MPLLTHSETPSLQSKSEVRRLGFKVGVFRHLLSSIFYDRGYLGSKGFCTIDLIPVEDGLHS